MASDPQKFDINAEETFLQLSKKATYILDDKASWTTVKTLPMGSSEMRLMKRPSEEKNKPSYVGASCIIKGAPLEEVLKTVIINLPQNCHIWDKTVVEFKTIQKISENHFVYQHVYDPGKAFYFISKRDIVYYEGWHQDPVTRQVVNVGSSVEQVQKVPLPDNNTVRSKLVLHCKRLTPVVGAENDSTFYEVVQQVEMGGNFPDMFALDGISNMLYEEINSYYGGKKNKK